MQPTFLILTTLTLGLFIAGHAKAEGPCDRHISLDQNFSPSVADPAFPDKQGDTPLVIIDEAHNNLHRIDGRFKAFADLLEKDGYRVESSIGRYSEFTRAKLKQLDILVIVNALHSVNLSKEKCADQWKLPTPSAFTDQEIADLVDWVSAGGSLLLMADHFPFPGAVEKLAAEFGVLMSNGHTYPVDVTKPIAFNDTDGTLQSHPITRGRAGKSEGVDTVFTFTGQAFRASPSATVQPLLLLGKGVRTYFPTGMSEEPAKFMENLMASPSIPSEGMMQGAALEFGKGRVVILGEAGIFTAQQSGEIKMGMNYPPAKQNIQFALNTMHWLSRLYRECEKMTLSNTVYGENEMKPPILYHTWFLRRVWNTSTTLAAVVMISALSQMVLAGSGEEQLNEIRVLLNQRSPMRDGVELANDVFLPKTPGRYPTLLMRTPYNKGGRRLDLPWDFTTYFARRGYAFVFQDVRGRGDSDGEFNYFHADVEDGYDSVEWAASQPWSNGKVCMFGLSYMGGVQWQAAKTKPPHLECLVSTAAAGDFLNEIDYGPGGTMTATSNLGWLYGVSERVWHEQQLGDLISKGAFDWNDHLWHRPLMTLDEKAFGFKIQHWRKILNHPTEDAYWKKIKLQPDDFKNINIPVLHITGWFDDDQHGATYFWRGMQNYSKAKNQQFMLIGPWNHVQTFFGGGESIGEMKFGPESVIDPLALHLQFFDRYLKGKKERFQYPKAKVYVTGANEWREYSEYPPLEGEDVRFYLHSGGKANSLKGDGSLKREKPGNQFADRYIFDPKNPVPTFADDKGGFYGADFRSVEARQDVLVYTSGVLSAPLDVIGNVLLELYASSDALDTDFFAKVLDVYPDGRAVRLGPWGGGLRARYRNGFENEELLTPGKVAKFTIDLDEIGHRFKKGHRIRVEVTSSSFPWFLPNQNTGNPVATDTEWKTAHQTIYHNKAYPSALVLHVIEEN